MTQHFDYDLMVIGDDLMGIGDDLMVMGDDLMGIGYKSCDSNIE